MYSQRLLDHFQAPRNVGDLEGRCVVVEVENPACGDRMRLSAEVAGGRIARIGYKVKGCTASIAAGSAMTEWLEGRSMEDLGAAGRKGVSEAVEAAVGPLPETSKHAARLCADAVEALCRAAKAD